MVVAIDFDGCLSTYKVQVLARKMIKNGIEVWVVTKRKEGKHNKDLFEVLDKIGLIRSQVIYTNNKSKVDYLQSINADLFIDNDTIDFGEINSSTNTLAVGYSNY